MSKNLTMFGMALALLTLITAVSLALLAGPTSPLTWLLVLILVAIPLAYRQLASRRYLTWREEYNTGIESIDHQHRKLVNLINQLQSAVEHSTGAEFEREALDGLVKYTRTHFSYEEQLMAEHDYPGYAAHRAEHNAMIEQVEAVMTEYDENPETAMQRAHDFLGNWLINHINGTDKAYSAYLLDRGVR